MTLSLYDQAITIPVVILPYEICQGPIPRIPQGRRLWLNKTGYTPIPSIGKRLGIKCDVPRLTLRQDLYTATFLPWLNTHPGPRVASLGSLRSLASDTLQFPPSVNG
jgi:hypothetical protein